MENTSISLLERMHAANDVGSWERFERLYRPWLDGWMRRVSLQAADGDDIVQDVLVVVVREIGSFHHNGRPGAFRAWLRGIVVNRVHEFIRRKGSQTLQAGDLRFFDDLADDHSTLSATWNREHDLHVMQKLLRMIADDFEPAT